MNPKQQTWVIIALFFVLMLGFGASARAEADSISKAEFDAVQKDLESMKAALSSLHKELERISELLVQRSAQPPRPPDRVTHVNISGNPMLGNKEAPITLIDFSDYQCPYCFQFVQTTWPTLKTEYIETGKVRYVFRHFPLDQIHPHARKAAEAAHCAGDQGKYWEMHDVLFHNQKALQVEQLKTYARSLGLEAAPFETCLEHGTYTGMVEQNYNDGVAVGIQGTPGFFLGKTRSEDTIQGIAISGAQPIGAFRQAIERLLAE